MRRVSPQRVRIGLKRARRRKPSTKRFKRRGLGAAVISSRTRVPIFLAARLDYAIIAVFSWRLQRKSDWEGNLSKLLGRKQKRLCLQSRSSSGTSKMRRRISAACQRNFRIRRLLMVLDLQQQGYMKP